MRAHIPTPADKIRIKVDTPVAGRHKMGWVVFRPGGQPGMRYWNDRTWPQLAKATHTDTPYHPQGCICFHAAQECELSIHPIS